MGADLDCPKKSREGYDCARSRGHKGSCLPLYNGVPIGEKWGRHYKKWALDNFGARCAIEGRALPTIRTRSSA